MRFAAVVSSSRHGRRRWFLIVTLLCFLSALMSAWAQESPAPSAEPQSTIQEPAVATPVHPTNARPAQQGLPSIWDLAVQGGIFMAPIALCSVVVAVYGIERFVGLRLKKIAPSDLISKLYALSTEEKGIDPRQAYEVCREHPSPLARIIEMGILKVGRPHAELEKAVEDAAAREADGMAANLKPINTAAVLGPQLGLIGTVQGMIMAFMVTSTTTATGAAKGQELAAGIYTALVTTFAGLCVSIPAIIIATMLESRIERLLRGMEDVFDHVLPQFERFEGKYRIALNSDASGVVLKGTVPKATASRSPVTEEPATANAPKGLWGVMGGKAE